MPFPTWEFDDEGDSEDGESAGSDEVDSDDADDPAEYRSLLLLPREDMVTKLRSRNKLNTDVPMSEIRRQ